MARKFSILMSFILLSFHLHAQQIRPNSSSQIYQQLQQLNKLGSVMYLAAHPDDENTRLISFLVHHENIRTVYLSLTRGDGGQNILGNEQGAALGLIRTHELLAARKIDGAEQLFTSAIDFGFTKTPKEVFQFWNKEKIVQEVVDAIQENQPDIIICRFPTTGEGGHGQHTASAIIALEAYRWIENYNKNTSNSKKLFLPKRLLFNAFKFGSASTIKPGQFTVATNQYNPLLGEGYGEMAGRSRSIHKSQGAGTPQSVGINLEHFELMAGQPMTNTLFDGINMDWSRVNKNKALGEKIEKVITEFKFENPSASIAPLIQIRKEIKQLKNSFWKYQKLKEIDQIILSCAGVMAEAFNPKPEAILGEELKVKLNVISRKNTSVMLEVPSINEKFALKNDTVFSKEVTFTLPDSGLTQPYWLKNDPNGYSYNYNTEKIKGLPVEKNEISIPIVIYIEGEPFSLQVPISYKYLSPTRGDVVEQLRVVPDLSIELFENLLIYQEGQENILSIRLKPNINIPIGYLTLRLNGKEIIKQDTIKNLTAQTVKDVNIQLPKRIQLNEQQQNVLNIAFHANHKVYDKNQHLIQYEHLPELQYFTKANIQIIPQNWKHTVQKVGYVEGVGDYVDDVLKLAGLEVSMISEKELDQLEYLKQFDAIIIGIRAFNTKTFLKNAMQNLLKYTENGGTLIVQYNTSMGLITDELGPYPLKIARERVTEEDAKVTILNPQSRVLNYPNKIESKDFDNWVQERGLYFPVEWDSKYSTVFSMHDENEESLSGGILYTKYGKGYYVYSPLSFFRQLPAGNIGAIRLLMNLISINH